MDISLLKTFLEVSRTKHFSRAADNLFVTSAAVSARIKLLEGQLGVRLFARHRGNIQLTSEGERLVPLAESMIDTWARALQEVALQPDMEARLHIGATSGMWLLVLQERLLDLMDHNPGLAVRAEGHSNEDLAELLTARKLDLALLPDPPTALGFRAEKIGELSLVLASKDPVEMDKAISEGYIYVDWGSAFANFHAKKFGEALVSSLHVNLSSIAINIIGSKGGAAYLPKSAVDSTASLYQVPDAPLFKRPIYACYLEGNQRVDLIRKVVAFLDGISI
ncbi:MAG: DNA-binding transcriptional LysR family regulator [Candidatus Azotimanducaceae bacterium]